jgi:DNA-binding MarR family transcriptional regulator
MKQVLTEKQATIYNFLTETDGEKFTAYQIADATGLERKAINVLVNGLCAKGYVVREEATVKDDEGKDTTVKYVVLTDAGRAYDEAAAMAHDEAEAAERKEAEKAKRAAKKAAKEAAAE